MLRSFDSSRLRVILVAGTAAIVAMLYAVLFFDVRFDDAYITFRYGQNLAMGRGLVFNPGERVMGSTSPGGALLAAAIYRMFGLEALPSVVSAIGSIAWVAQAVCVYAMLRRALGTWGAAFVGCVVVAVFLLLIEIVNQGVLW